MDAQTGVDPLVNVGSTQADMAGALKGMEGQYKSIQKEDKELASESADTKAKMNAAEGDITKATEKEIDWATRNQPKPFEAGKPPNPKDFETDAWQSFGSLASVLGILGSALTRKPIAAALNASAAAMNARKQNDRQGFDDAMKAFNENTTHALEQSKQEQKQYEDALSLMEKNIAAGDARLRYLSNLYEHQAMDRARLSGQAGTLVGSIARVNEQLTALKAKTDEDRAKDQARTDRLNKAGYSDELLKATRAKAIEAGAIDANGNILDPDKYLEMLKESKAKEGNPIAEAKSAALKLAVEEAKAANGGRPLSAEQMNGIIAKNGKELPPKQDAYNDFKADLLANPDPAVRAKADDPETIAKFNKWYDDKSKQQSASQMKAVAIEKIMTENPGLTQAQAAGQYQGQSDAQKAIADGSKLSDEALEFLAGEYLWNRDKPALGLSGATAAQRSAVYDRAAQMAKNAGMTVADIMAAQDNVKSEIVKLNAVTRQQGMARNFETTAKLNMEQARKALNDMRGDKSIYQSNMPVLQHWLLNGAEAIGEAKAVGANVALITFLDEYAKVISGSTGAAGSTDAAREQALSLVSRALNSGQVDAAFSQMTAEMNNRLTGYDKERRDTMNEIRGAFSPKKYTVGDTIQKGGQTYRVTGGDPSDPDVELVKPSGGPR